MEELKTITNALEVANLKGSFTLHESAVIFTAITKLTAEVENIYKAQESVKIPKEE